jgi:nucleoid-associated protein YgaU
LIDQLLYEELFTMKKLVIAAGLMTAVVLVSGCRSTNVAGVTRSQEEQNWEQMIRRNYPGYRAPRAAAPANFDNTETRTSSVREPLRPEPAPEPAAVPEAMPENKTETPAMDIPEAPQAAPAADAPAEPKADVPAEAKADTPAETKTAAVEVPQAEPKADAPAVQPPDPTSGTVYVVKSGDTLGKIAQKHYGKAAYSNLIFKANSDILKNPNQLRPGMKLIIPTL